MPGAAIGKQLNPPTDIVWQGRIRIRKIGAGEHRVDYQDVIGDPEAIELVKEHFNKFVEQLNERHK